MKVKKTYAYPLKVVGGVAYDGRDVWFADPENDAVARVDRKSGRITGRLRGPKVGSGTAWDGTHLWQVGDGKLQRVDPSSGKVVRTLPVPDAGFISGLAWDGEALWVGAGDQKKLYKIHPQTGKVLRSLSSDRFVTGITWIGEELWHAVLPEKDRPTEVRQVDSRTGKVLRRAKVPFQISGMAHDGKAAWCGDCNEGKLRVLELKGTSKRAHPIGR